MQVSLSFSLSLSLWYLFPLKRSDFEIAYEDVSHRRRRHLDNPPHALQKGAWGCRMHTKSSYDEENGLAPDCEKISACHSFFNFRRLSFRFKGFGFSSKRTIQQDTLVTKRKEVIGAFTEYHYEKEGSSAAAMVPIEQEVYTVISKLIFYMLPFSHPLFFAAARGSPGDNTPGQFLSNAGGR